MGFFDGFLKFREDRRRNNTGSRRKYEPISTASAISSDWGQIDILISQKGPSQLRQALILADKSLDNALRKSYNGDSMADRLKEARERFEPSLYDKIWRAHKMRNALVHESGYEPQSHMIIDAVETLRKGLQKLGVRV